MGFTATRFMTRPKLQQVPAVISLENLSTYIGQPFGAQNARIESLRYTDDPGSSNQFFL